MKEKGIEEIKAITEKKSQLNDEKLKKFAKKVLKQQEKQIDATIKKLHKEIYKTARKGEFDIYYHFGCLFDMNELNRIKNHFEEQGYEVELIKFNLIPYSIKIKWN